MARITKSVIFDAGCKLSLRSLSADVLYISLSGVYLRIKALSLSLLPALVFACGALMLLASSASAATSPTNTALALKSFDQVVADTAQG
jgi:hypothetical protein